MITANSVVDRLLKKCSVGSDALLKGGSSYDWVTVDEPPC